MCLACYRCPSHGVSDGTVLVRQELMSVARTHAFYELLGALLLFDDDDVYILQCDIGRYF